MQHTLVSQFTTNYQNVMLRHSGIVKPGPGGPGPGYQFSKVIANYFITYLKIHTTELAQ